MRELLAHLTFRGVIRERSVDPFLRLLEAVRLRRRIRGVLLDISSGGGEAVASTDLYLGIKRLDADKPVYASIGAVGASGAYLAAVGARRVFAYPESQVGSIGVVFPHVAVRELLRRIGISVDLLHIGSHKDAFQGYRPLTDEERTKLLAVAQASYDEFVGRVAEARRRPVDEVRGWATGEIWSGRAALALGLVDSLGDRRAVLEALAAATGVPVRRTVRVAPRRPFLERVLAGGLGGTADGLTARLRDSIEDAVLDLGGPALYR
jgi:protease IV